MWQATPGTLGSSKALTHTRSFAPRNRNVVLTQGKSSACAALAAITSAIAKPTAPARRGETIKSLDIATRPFGAGAAAVPGARDTDAHSVPCGWLRRGRPRRACRPRRYVREKAA